MGKWMEHSGESVFGTRGGKFPEKANQPVTIKENTLYVHVFPNFHKEIIIEDIEETPKQVILLRTNGEIPFSYQNNRLVLQIPPLLRTRMVDTIKIIQ